MRIAVLAVVLMLFGCAAAPAPPTEVAPCGASSVFYVVNHGWHTGLVIASRDLLKALPALTDEFADAQFVEIGWGDAGFYRAPEVTLGLALRALFRSQATVLHVVKVSEDPQRYFAGSEMIELRVTEDGYRQLLAFVARTFTRSPKEEVEALGPGLYGNSRFFRAGGSYSLSYTCNTWVAEAVAASGLPISSASVLTAGSVMSQLRQATSVTTSCVYAH